jgi:hypothetical protein
MFLTTLEAKRPSTPEHPTSPSKSVFAEFAQAFLKLPSFLDKRVFNGEPTTSRHKHWNVERYFELVKDERYQKWWIMKQLLYQDFITFTDEAVVPQYKTGPYLFTPKGLPNSYQDESRVYSSGFIEQQQKEDASRAEIEAEKWHELEQWVHLAETTNTVPVGQTFIWFSPRGTVAEGYLGTESTNPNLISVYTKYDHGVEMQQFKTWSTTRQLEKTITQLGYPLKKTLKNPSHNCIASSGVCPRLVTIAEIETEIYRSELGDPTSPDPTDHQPWPVTKDHLSLVDLDEFNLYREGVFELYAEYVLKYLFKSINSPKQLEKKKKLLPLLDLFFSIAVKTLNGWVYFNDQRSDKSKTYKSTLISSVEKDSEAEKFLRATSDNVRTLLESAFATLEDMTFNPNSITAADAGKLTTLFKSLMMETPQRAFSLGQCVSLALPSWALSSSNMSYFKGGRLPTAIAIEEGWLNRQGVCARGEDCVSHLKGLTQNLGPCDWCWDCDGRFGYLRTLGKMDHRLFKKGAASSKAFSANKGAANRMPKKSGFDHAPHPAQSSITLTQFLAGDYVAA